MKLIFSMQLKNDLTSKTMEETKFKMIIGRLPNPKLKVFFIDISIIKQGKKLSFGM